jgi:hypothetical protein
MALPNSNKYIRYIPDALTSKNISYLIEQKKIDPNINELRYDGLSIILLDTYDKSGLKTGYMTKNGAVAYDIRWTNIIRSCLNQSQPFTKYVTVKDMQQSVQSLATWEQYWVTDLQNEFIHLQLRQVDPSEKQMKLKL